MARAEIRAPSGSVHSVSNVFFEPAGTGVFVAGPATAGPWSAGAQHGGPPSALAARALELHEPDERQRLARVAVDILRPVPLGKITVRTRTVRPGRRVALLEAVLEADGQEVLHARGWRLAIPDGGVPAVTPGPAPPPIPAEHPLPAFPGGHMTGYLRNIDWRYIGGGGFDVPGPATVWARPKIPLIPGEEPSPMCRALLLADSGSGVSSTLDPVKFLFINTDLTVILPRDPAGEWLLLDAVSTIGERGTGLAETALSDVHARCGTAVQTLLVAPR
jgi:Acyl-CoA thioesterase N-terminal domain/Acyl-CoA thioesterase C-terminal domain